MLVLIYSTLLGRQPREVTPAKRQIPSLEKAIEPSLETNRSCGPGTNFDSQVANKTGSLRASSTYQEPGYSYLDSAAS